MSFHALAWAVRQRLPSTQKLVLLMLAERHNGDSGQCNPSLELLADDCGLSRRSVIDQIAKLQEAGYLTVLHRAKDNARLPSQYVLRLSFGIPEAAKTIPADPYLVPEKVVNDVHQGSERAAPGVVNDVHQVVNVLHEGGERRAHKPGSEPGKEPIQKKEKRASAPSPSIPGIADDLLSDFLAVRKAKRAGPLTDTALAGIRREAEKAGLTLEQAITACCEFGWQGFNAGWYADRTAGRAATTPRRADTGETAYQRSMRERIEEAAPDIARRAPAPRQDAADFLRTVDAVARVVPTTAIEVTR